jgi:outer membrane receptor protein involved in Fe transport
VFDAGGGWRPADNVDLRLLVRNLADKDYPASPDAAPVLAPGRTAQLMVSVIF